MSHLPKKRLPGLAVHAGSTVFKRFLQRKKLSLVAFSHSLACPTVRSRRFVPLNEVQFFFISFPIHNMPPPLKRKGGPPTRMGQTLPPTAGGASKSTHSKSIWSHPPKNETDVTIPRSGVQPTPNTAQSTSIPPRLPPIRGPPSLPMLSRKAKYSSLPPTFCKIHQFQEHVTGGQDDSHASAQGGEQNIPSFKPPGTESIFGPPPPANNINSIDPVVARHVKRGRIIAHQLQNQKEHEALLPKKSIMSTGPILKRIMSTGLFLMMMKKTMQLTMLSYPIHHKLLPCLRLGVNHFHLHSIHHCSQGTFTS